MGKSERQRPRVRPRRRWQENIKCLFKKKDTGVDCTDLVQERDKGRFLVKAIINRWVTENENFLLDKKILAFEEELCSVELVS